MRVGKTPAPLAKFGGLQIFYPRGATQPRMPTTDSWPRPRRKSPVMQVRSRLIAALAIVFGAIGCGGKYDSPEACFQTIRMAAHKEDITTFYELSLIHI